MIDLANQDQALRNIWDEIKRKPGNADDLVIEFGRRVLKMAEGKEMLGKMLNEPGADAPLK